MQIILKWIIEKYGIKRELNYPSSVVEFSGYMEAENFLNCKDFHDERNVGMIYINRSVRVGWSNNAIELYSGGPWFEFRLDHLLS